MHRLPSGIVRVENRDGLHLADIDEHVEQSRSYGRRTGHDQLVEEACDALGGLVPVGEMVGCMEGRKRAGG